MVVAFRENRARKVRDKSSYVSSGIRLRLCVGRCQIQIALRWRHFGENKKSSNSRSGRDRSNREFFPKSQNFSPLHFSPPLGETNFQPIISRSPFILHSFRPFSRAFSCARSPNLAECNFRRIKVDVAEVEAPSQLVNQVGGGGGEESVNFWYVKKFEACPCPPWN